MQAIQSSLPTNKKYKTKFPPILMANWKPYRSKEEFDSFSSHLTEDPFIQSHPIYLALPFSFIKEEAARLGNGGIIIGSNSMTSASSGSFTEEIAAKILRETHTRFVLLDSSEKNLESLSDKIQHLLQDGYLTAVCLGESLDQFASGSSLESLKGQVQQCLENIPEDQLDHLIFIYTSPWISLQGLTHLSENIDQSYDLFRFALEETVGQKKADKIRVMTTIPSLACNYIDFIQNSKFEGFLFQNLAIEEAQFLETIGQIKQNLPDWLETKSLVKESIPAPKETLAKAESIAVEEETEVEPQIEEEKEEIQEAEPEVEPAVEEAQERTYKVGDVTSWGATPPTTEELD